ncbi:MAG: methyltransferase domain-containing protein [bacterium]
MHEPVYRVFDEKPGAYDSWYDSEVGRPLYESELICLKPLLNGLARPWLESGAGTGRFAVVLGMDYASDPAGGALRLASQRGVRAVISWGQQLPFKDESMGAVFIIYALPFAGDQEGMVQDAARAAMSGGHVVLGVVPAESEWGRFYSDKARQNDSFFTGAVFLPLAQVLEMASGAGLLLETANSTLYQSPLSHSFHKEESRSGADPEAGFVALRFKKTRQGRHD